MQIPLPWSIELKQVRKIPAYKTTLLASVCFLNKFNVTSISDYLTKQAEEQLTAD